MKFDSLLYSFSSFYTRPIKRTRKNTVVKLLHYISPFFVLHNCLILQIYCMFLLSVSKIGENLVVLLPLSYSSSVPTDKNNGERIFSGEICSFDKICALNTEIFYVIGPKKLYLKHILKSLIP